jgi:hypothetical protein
MVAEGKLSPMNDSFPREQRNDRADFRIIARAMNGKCPLEEPEWHKKAGAKVGRAFSGQPCPIPAQLFFGCRWEGASGRFSERRWQESTIGRRCDQGNAPR